jgi:ABC-type sugar transport system, permease component
MSVAGAVSRRAVSRQGGQGRRVRRFLVYALLVGAAIYYLLPIYVLLVTSLKNFDQISLARMWELPTGANFGSFADAWGRLAPNFLNSILIAVPAAVISSMVGSINGYVLAKWRFRGSDTIFTLILFGMFIPYQAILIPLVQLTRGLGVNGTIEGLVLVHSSTASRSRRSSSGTIT